MNKSALAMLVASRSMAQARRIGAGGPIGTQGNPPSQSWLRCPFHHKEAVVGADIDTVFDQNDRMV